MAITGRAGDRDPTRPLARRPSPYGPHPHLFRSPDCTAIVQIAPSIMLNIKWIYV